MNMYSPLGGMTGYTPASDAAQTQQMQQMAQTQTTMAQAEAARLLRMRQDQARNRPLDTATPAFGGNAAGPVMAASTPAPPAAAPVAAPVSGNTEQPVLPDQKIVNRNLFNRPPKGRAARGGMTAQEAQAARDQVQLAKPFLAFNDVLQAPMAAALNASGALGAGMYNLGGRTINALTGKPLVETDKQSPIKFGITPFFDAARRREAEIDKARGLPRGEYQSPYTDEQRARLAELRKVAPAPPAATQAQAQAPNFESLAAAVMQVESGGNPNAISPKGAVGTMQTMPGTLSDPGFGVTPARDNSPAEQERVGRDYLQAMIAKYGNVEHALVAYNWGPTNATKWIKAGADPAALPKETREYVPKVMSQLGGASPQVAPAPVQAETPVNGAAAPATPARTFSPEEVAQFGVQTQQSVRAAQMRISELANSAKYAVTYQERNSIQKQVDDLRYGMYDAQLKDVALRAGTGDQTALAQLAQEAGIPYAQTENGVVPVMMGPDGQWRASGAPMPLQTFANRAYAEANGAAAKQRAAAQKTQTELQADILLEREKGTQALRKVQMEGESALQKLYVEGQLPKDWKVSRDPLGGPVIVTNSQGVFRVDEPTTDPGTGIPMGGGLVRIQ